MFLLLATFVGFLLCSGLMASVDAAVLSVTLPEIEVLKDRGSWGARRLGQVKDQLEQSVAVVVIFSNTVNVAGPILVSLQAFRLGGTRGTAAATVALTIGTIVFSEIIPKAIGSHYAPTIARLSSPAILACRTLIFPLVWLLAWPSRQFTRGEREIGTEEQIRSLAEIGHQSGHIEGDEHQMIHRVFRLNDKTAAEIMTPLDRVHFLRGHQPVSEAVHKIAKCDHAQFPVLDDDAVDVAGIVAARDVFRSEMTAPTRRIETLQRPPVLVPADCKSDQLIEIFQTHRTQIAIVTRHDTPIGIVTLDDVLRQLIQA